jgi:hypothetical protein
VLRGDPGCGRRLVSGIAEVGEEVRKNREGEETLVTKIPEVGRKKEQSNHG